MMIGLKHVDQSFETEATTYAQYESPQVLWEDRDVE
jgi:hypothetical protein